MSEYEGMTWKTKLISLIGATTPALVFGWRWGFLVPPCYWLLKRVITLLPSQESLALAKAREAQSLFFLSALSGSLKSGLPLLSALSNVLATLNSSLRIEIERVRSLLLLGADPKQAWADLVGDPVLGTFAKAIARAQVDGRSLATVIDRIVEETFAHSLMRSKEEVKSLSVKLALPVGLCFLPSFLIGGIGPVIFSFFISLNIF